MDLPDIRASLAEQNWVMRIGKGSHGVWYPPDRSKRPVSIPMNGKAPTNEAGRAGLRATLRRSGWIDPEYVNRKPLPRADSGADSTETDAGAGAEPLASEPVSAGATTLPNPSSTSESTDMSSTTDSAPTDEPTVVEEAWAHNAGGISASVKEQLLSDGTVRYRCAHPLGGGCSWTHATLQGVVGHQKAHRYRRQAASAAEPSAWQIAAQMRATRAQSMVADQARDMIAAARDSGQAVRGSAIIPAGMGAGRPTDTVHIVATPSGDVTFECAASGCDYSADRYERVFAHRGWMHSKRRGTNTDHSDGMAATDAQDPVTQITANGTRADPLVHASALPVTAAVSPTTVSGALSEALQRRTDPTDAELEPTVVTAAEATAEAIVEQQPPAVATPPAAATPAQAPGGSPFQETVEYLREQCAQMVDHLRVVAASEYDHTAALRARDAEIERLTAQMAVALQTRDILQAEVDDLRTERKQLVTARDQLAQLRGMFRTLGMAD